MTAPAAPPLTRRQFMTGVTAVSAGVIAAANFPRIFTSADLARAAGTGDPNARKLVLIQLSGGADGLATVIPFNDSAYLAKRPTLRYTQAECVLSTIDGAAGRALNPVMTYSKQAWDAGRLAIVHGVSYTNPDLSHFRSTAIWQTADPVAAKGTGWIGRYLDVTRAQGGHEPLRGAILGGGVPPTFIGTTTSAGAVPAQRSTLFGGPTTNAQDARRNAAYTAMSVPLDATNRLRALVQGGHNDLVDVATSVNPLISPNTTFQHPAGTNLRGISSQLWLAATMINANLPTRVYGAGLGGFDDHSNERLHTQSLLGQLDDAVEIFFSVLAPAHWDKVVVMTYSEFGRRVEENGSLGTDHGTSAPMYIYGSGPSFSAGQKGTMPSLNALDRHGNLSVTMQFQSVYREVVGWLGADPNAVVPGNFVPVGVLS